jgi:hypothetical protein
MSHRSDLDRYAQLIHSMIPAKSAFQSVAEGPSQIQVERGLYLPVVEFQGDRAVQIVDAGGHARPAYRPLLIYSWLLTAEKAGEIQASSVSLAPWITKLDDGILSAMVRAAGGTLFKNEKWTANARRRFEQLVDHQQSSGAFFAADSKANPETRWYDELIALHAIASYSVWTNDQRAAKAARQSAMFHLNETQPDHASAQPWGLLAFAQYAPPMADQLLHALTMQYPAGVTGVPLLLLTDALYGLRQVIARESQPTTNNQQLTTDNGLEPNDQ